MELKCWRPCSTSPACAQALRTPTKVIPSGFRFSSLCIFKKSSIASFALPCIARPPIIAFHEKTLFCFMFSKTSHAMSKRPHLAYMSNNDVPRIASNWIEFLLM
ncbi:hypothetical protein Scep_030251 [Stephania cephalantha]|uniref:Uncharacterized protein n=1 Tax=Stephania cephalantha TaxID=152367 RepID=A0AAP0E239_9MAGN